MPLECAQLSDSAEVGIIAPPPTNSKRSGSEGGASQYRVRPRLRGLSAWPGGGVRAQVGRQAGRVTYVALDGTAQRGYPLGPDRSRLVALEAPGERAERVTERLANVRIIRRRFERLSHLKK